MIFQLLSISYYVDFMLNKIHIRTCMYYIDLNFNKGQKQSEMAGVDFRIFECYIFKIIAIVSSVCDQNQLKFVKDPQWYFLVTRNEQ